LLHLRRELNFSFSVNSWSEANKNFSIFIFLAHQVHFFYFSSEKSSTLQCLATHSVIGNGHELESLCYWEFSRQISAKTCMESYPHNRWYFVFIAVFTKFMLGFLHEEHNFYFLLTEYTALQTNMLMWLYFS